MEANGWGAGSEENSSRHLWEFEMSVNLNKNRAQILDAWKKVTEHEDGYDWALFGYEGKSFDLKVVSEK